MKSCKSRFDKLKKICKENGLSLKHDGKQYIISCRLPDEKFSTLDEVERNIDRIAHEADVDFIRFLERNDCW